MTSSESWGQPPSCPSESKARSGNSPILRLLEELLVLRAIIALRRHLLSASDCIPIHEASHTSAKPSA